MLLDCRVGSSLSVPLGSGGEPGSDDQSAVPATWTHKSLLLPCHLLYCVTVFLVDAVSETHPSSAMARLWSTGDAIRTTFDPENYNMFLLTVA